jgi:release factor glutamine methyltransferase
MRPSEVVRRGAGYLARHEIDSPLASAERLLMRVLETDRAGLYARRDGLSTAEAKAYGALLCRRCTGVPTQHLTGEAGFRRLVINVEPGVFVPRPETESLVDVALELLRGVHRPVVVDVGTGTGAVALSIADEVPGVRVLAIDRSADAVSLARRNAEELDLSVDVRQGDLLDRVPVELRGAVDLVVSNPPYVDPAEAAALPPEVLADPPLALFGGLDVYQRLFDQARTWLRTGGGLAVEVDPRSAADVADVAARAGYLQVSIARDLAGRDRVVRARRP